MSRDSEQTRGADDSCGSATGEPSAAELLQGVSRTFALSIPELPPPLDDWVGSAYLVCRIVDTLEDRAEADEIERQRMFDDLLATLGPPLRADRCRSLVARFAARDSGDACTRLMTCCDGVFGRLVGFPLPALDAIRQCVGEMIDGLRRTPVRNGAQPPRFVCQTLGELERYCHHAAGVVGLMLTRLFCLHLGQGIGPAALEQGRRFGLGLQLTNILKDHPSDLEDGRCFIPPEAAHRCGLDPADLLRPLLPLGVRRLIADLAASHLDCAMSYSLAFPADPPGIRLFCLQPMMMALLTLRRVLTQPDATPDDRPRITREQVADVIATSHRLVADDAELRAWYQRHRENLTLAPPCGG